MSGSTDYFELLGLPTHLAIDTEDLQRRFYDLSRKFHPDKFARKSEAERQVSLDTSSLLNDAYRTLRDPVKRAEYVLKQQGFDIGEHRGKILAGLDELRAGRLVAASQLLQRHVQLEYFFE